MNNISIKDFIERFEKGEFDNPDVNVQCEAGWYDWFCKDSSLARKTKRLGRVVSQLKTSNRVDIDKDYVFFKNNCPVAYPLYDDFRICDLKEGNVKYTVSYKNPYYKGERWTVFGIDNDFDAPLLEVGTVKELIAFLNEGIERL